MKNGIDNRESIRNLKAVPAGLQCPVPADLRDVYKRLAGLAGRK